MEDVVFRSFAYWPSRATLCRCRWQFGFVDSELVQVRTLLHRAPLRDVRDEKNNTLVLGRAIAIAKGLVQQGNGNVLAHGARDQQQLPCADLIANVRYAQRGDAW